MTCSVVSLALAWRWRGICICYRFIGMLWRAGSILRSGVFACTRPVVGQFPVPPESAFFKYNLCTRVYMCLQFYCVQCASCSVLLSFSVFFPPSSPFIISSNGIVVLISPLNLVQCDGCLGWGWVCRAGLVAELWVGKAFGVFLLPGIGVGSSSSQGPKNPTSMCNSGVNQSLSKLEKNH